MVIKLLYHIYIFFAIFLGIFLFVLEISAVLWHNIYMHLLVNTVERQKYMNDYIIEKLDLADYSKCNNIWDMSAFSQTEFFRKEIEAGNRVVYVYKQNGEFIGEIAYVFDMHDDDYTIVNQRIYLSRLIVKKERRENGIGGILIDFIIEQVRNMGYKEVTIGVDKDNIAALHLYRKKGFTTILFDGADEDGEYFKLMKKL